MTLRLVSSGDDRALAVRDHLVPLVRLSGSQEVQRDSVRLISLQRGSWIITHWTPPVLPRVLCLVAPVDWLKVAKGRTPCRSRS